MLIHGMMGESRQFWQVGPALAGRGYRAIAVDLPGHGHSPPCLTGGLPAFAEALVASVPGTPQLAVGHSLGAIVLAFPLPGLQPNRAVYVDVPFKPQGPSSDSNRPDPGGPTATDVSRKRPLGSSTFRPPCR